MTMKMKMKMNNSVSSAAERIKNAANGSTSYIAFPDGSLSVAGTPDGNNCLLSLYCGASDSGKTEAIKLTIPVFNGSMVIISRDDKLYKQFHEELEAKGTGTYLFSRFDPADSVSFNPLENMCTGSDVAGYADIFTEASADENAQRNSFWTYSKRLLFNAVLGALAEGIEGFDKNLFGLYMLISLFEAEDMKNKEKSRIYRLFSEHADKYRARTGKRSGAFEQFRKFVGLAPETLSCVILEAQASLAALNSAAVRRITYSSSFSAETLFAEKSAVFVQTDSFGDPKDIILDLFVFSLVNRLCRFAGAFPDGMLPIPTLFVFDDLGSMAKIGNFMSLLSDIRSIRIPAILAVQALSQLEINYGKAYTALLNNCDNLIYTGGSDPQTADYFSRVFNVPLETVMDMPLKHHFIRQRGKEPRLAKTVYYRDICAYLDDAEEMTAACGKERKAAV